MKKSSRNIRVSSELLTEIDYVMKKYSTNKISATRYIAKIFKKVRTGSRNA